MGQEIAAGVSFAAIGLMDMFNSGGSVEEIEISHRDSSSVGVRIRVKGSGRFGVYCSHSPLMCMVDDVLTHFNYHTPTGLLTFFIPLASPLCLVHILV